MMNRDGQRDYFRDSYRDKPEIVRPFEAKTRLVCPCCHMGFISITDEMENKYTFPNETRSLVIRTNYPKCENCNTKFEVSIDRTLKITMRRV